MSAPSERIEAPSEERRYLPYCYASKSSATCMRSNITHPPPPVRHTKILSPGLSVPTRASFRLVPEAVSRLGAPYRSKNTMAVVCPILDGVDYRPGQRVVLTGWGESG